MANFHIPENISTAFDVTKRRIRLSTRLMMEDTFNFWRRQFAPRHFTRQAYQYQSYKDSYKRTFHPGGNHVRRSHKVLQWRIDKGRDTAMPMVKTGAGRDAFLKGNVRFRGSNQRLVAVFEDLPRYMYMYAKGTINKHEALTEILPAERTSLLSFAADRMAFHINNRTLRGRAAGRISI